MNELLEPGMFVKHPGKPEWGLGQVQSVINGKITVNFEQCGKMTLDGKNVPLTQIFDLDAERK